MHKGRGLVVALVVTLGSTLMSAQDTEKANKLQADLKAKKRDFEDGQKKAKEVVLSAFDKATKQLRDARTDPVMKRQEVRRLDDARNEFEKSGKLPDDEKLLPAMLAYYGAVWRCYEPVVVCYDKLVDEFIKAKDQIRADATVKDKAEYERVSLGADSFTAGSFWQGSMIYPDGGTVRFHLQVLSIQQGTLEARCVWNPGVAGSPEFIVNGRKDGFHLVFKKTKVVQGDSNPLSFDGFAMGRSVVTQWLSADRKGKVTGGLLRLAQ